MKNLRSCQCNECNLLSVGLNLPSRVEAYHSNTKEWEVCEFNHQRQAYVMEIGLNLWNVFPAYSPHKKYRKKSTPNHYKSFEMELFWHLKTSCHSSWSYDSSALCFPLCQRAVVLYWNKAMVLGHFPFVTLASKAGSFQVRSRMDLVVRLWKSASSSLNALSS